MSCFTIVVKKNCIFEIGGLLSGPWKHQRSIVFESIIDKTEVKPLMDILSYNLKSRWISEPGITYYVYSVIPLDG